MRSRSSRSPSAAAICAASSFRGRRSSGGRCPSWRPSLRGGRTAGPRRTRPARARSLLARARPGRADPARAASPRRAGPGRAPSSPRLGVQPGIAQHESALSPGALLRDESARTRLFEHGDELGIDVAGRDRRRRAPAPRARTPARRRARGRAPRRWCSFACRSATSPARVCAPASATSRSTRRASFAGSACSCAWSARSRSAAASSCASAAAARSAARRAVSRAFAAAAGPAASQCLAISASGAAGLSRWRRSRVSATRRWIDEAPRAEIGVEHLAEEAVGEGEAHRRWLDEHAGREAAARRATSTSRSRAGSSEIGERRGGELAPEHRGRIERGAQVVGQAREVRPDRGAHAVGDGQASGARRSGRAHDVKQLSHVERVAFAHAVEVVDRFGGERAPRGLARPAPPPAPRPRRARVARAGARAPIARAAPAGRHAPASASPPTSRYVTTSTTGRSTSAGARKSVSASDGASAACRSSRTRNSGVRAATAASCRWMASKRVKRSAPSASGRLGARRVREGCATARERRSNPARLKARAICTHGQNAGAPPASQTRPQATSIPAARALTRCLVGEPGLADTRLARDGDDRAAPLARRLGSARKSVELSRALDEEPRHHAPSLAPSAG